MWIYARRVSSSRIHVITSLILWEDENEEYRIRSITFQTSVRERAYNDYTYSVEREECKRSLYKNCM